MYEAAASPYVRQGDGDSQCHCLAHLARLQKLVAAGMGHFERLRKAEEQGLLKGFGVCELPKGLQLS